MTIVSNQPTLEPNDYPDFESTVGNSFASSFPDNDMQEVADLKKAESVAGGLYKIYENVVEEAASGSPMTARDSAIVANTVANMTASIGVESYVKPIASMESLYQRQIGHQITMEGLGKTIKAAFVRLFELMKKVMRAFIDKLGDGMQAIKDRSRKIARLINNLDRVTSMSIRVPYKSEYSGILVDGDIPARPFNAYDDTFMFVMESARELQRIMQYSEEILNAIRDSRGKDPEDSQKKILDIVNNGPKLNITGLTNRARKDDALVQWTKPLCNNTVGIVLSPAGDAPINAMNYGSALIRLESAAEYGITTRYNLKNDVEGKSITPQFTELVKYGSRAERQAGILADSDKSMRIILTTLEKLVDELPKIIDSMFDKSDEAASPDVMLQYAQAARGAVVGAQQCYQGNVALWKRIDYSMATFAEDFVKKCQQVNGKQFNQAEA